MDVFFASASGAPRPVRLPEATRAFAKESLDAKYGRELYSSRSLSIEDPAFDALTDYQKYDSMISLIARECPLRICPGELLVGSATLLDSSEHVVPVVREGRHIFSSVSHLTVNFDRMLREGLGSYEERARKRLLSAAPGEVEFLDSIMNVIAAVRVYHSRYLELVAARAEAASGDEREYYLELAANLANVPFGPPENFRQGLQSVWFMFSFLRLCGNWPGFGRLDQMLGPLLDRDLAAGNLTIDRARELIAHFFIKGCEWITLDPRGGGDGQHYQNIVLGGIDERGNEVSNTLTRLILEVVEELPIGDFPIAVRINEHTEYWLYRKIAEVMRHGSGVCAVYNERLIIDSMTEFHYGLDEARRFANDGCWEVQVPGKTFFMYHSMDALQLFQDEVLCMGSETPDYINIGAMLDALYRAIDRQMAEFHCMADQVLKGDSPPATAVALMIDDCIENARDYKRGGARYTVFSPHYGGIPDVANSLHAIDMLVFREKKLKLGELVELLRRDWEGQEALRRSAATKYDYFGNDSDEVDGYARAIVQRFIEAAWRVKLREGVLRPPGISTFGRQVSWKDERAACAQGSVRGDILSSNLCPAPGTDREGATAAIKSHCAAGLARLTCGTALDIKLDPSSVSGDEGIGGIISLIRGFVALDGFFMQIDVIDNNMLLEAQKHPERYQSLAVRISGWTARFVTLDDVWQRMIIERSTQSGM